MLLDNKLNYAVVANRRPCLPVAICALCPATKRRSKAPYIISTRQNGMKPPENP